MIKNVCPAAAMLALFAGACAAQSQHLVTVCLKGGEPAYAYVYDSAGKVAQSGRGAACRAAGHWVSELTADGKPAPRPTPGLRGATQQAQAAQQAGSSRQEPPEGRPAPKGIAPPTPDTGATLEALRSGKSPIATTDAGAAEAQAIASRARHEAAMNSIRNIK